MPWLNQRFASCRRGVLTFLPGTMPRCLEQCMQKDTGRPWVAMEGIRYPLPGINHTKGYPGILIYIYSNENYVPKNLLLNCASESVSPL